MSIYIYIYIYIYIIRTHEHTPALLDESLHACNLELDALVDGLQLCTERERERERERDVRQPRLKTRLDVSTQLSVL